MTESWIAPPLYNYRERLQPYVCAVITGIMSNSEGCRWTVTDIAADAVKIAEATMKALDAALLKELQRRDTLYQPEDTQHADRP
jgi:hypothetical protein